uniref:G-protein coupled receptors family 1 profile domain-containing protein n=1 Tax=Echeneis naucrates TaxID=173247 RepID=A0A665WXR8_ECHNA
SAHCGSQPAGHHLHLPLQAEINISLLGLQHVVFCMLILSLFRQLQSPTNLLLLSLAVSDFLVGFFQMPTATLLFRGCWILSDFICIGTYVFGALILGASVGNMLLISIDRYMAICEPMLYCIRVTVKRVQLCVCLCWIISGVFSSWFHQNKSQPDKENACLGECVYVGNDVEDIVDLAVTFLGPILIIIILYLRVFVVAVSQARAMQIKAAVTLGIVVAVFLLCYCPYYCFAMASLKSQVKATSSALQLLLLYINSSLNPMIYAFFYPWFRKAIRHIVTLQILQPGSSQTRFK